MIEPTRQVPENPLSLLGGRTVPSLTQYLLDSGMQRPVEPLDDIASLVHLAALDQSEVPKGVAYGPAQRLGAIDDEQAGDIRSQPALDQVRHQHMVADTQPIDLDHQQIEP